MEEHELERSKNLFAAKKYKAQIEYLKGLKLDYDVCFDLVSAYYILGDTELAGYYNKLVGDLTKDSIRLNFHIGLGHSLESEWGKVVAVLSDIENPPLAKWLLSNAFYELKQWHSASKGLREWYKLTGDSNALFLEGRAHFSNEKYENALNCFSSYIELFGSVKPLQKLDALLNRGLCYYKLSLNDLKYADKAIEDASEIITSIPTDIEVGENQNALSPLFNALTLRGRCFYLKNRLKQALADFGRAFEEKPKDEQTVLFIAGTKAKLNRWTEAIEDLKLLNKHKEGVDPYPNIIWEIGMYKAQMGHYEEALEDFMAVLAHDKSNNNIKVKALASIGWMSFQKGDIQGYEEIIKDLEDLVGGDHPGVMEFKAEFFLNTRDNHNAAVLYEKLNDDVSLTNLGIAYYNTDRKLLAWDCYNRAVENGEALRNYIPRKNRALYYRIEKKWQEAQEDLKIAKDWKGDLSDPEIEFGIEECERELESDEAFNESPLGLEGKRLIEEKVDAILQDLIVNDDRDLKFFVHYTSLSSAKAIIDGGPSKSFLRAGEVSYMNDPAEGQIIFRHLNSIEQPWAKGLSSFIESYNEEQKIKAFSISLIPEKGEESKSDHLIFWRLYGKENGKEGAGCSLRLNLAFFAKPQRTGGSGVLSIGVENKIFQLYRVNYLNKIEDSKGLNELVDVVQTSMTSIEKWENEGSAKIKEYLFWALIRVSYLFKSKQFEYEDEVRLLHVRRMRNSEGMKMAESSPGQAPKLYLDYDQRTVIRTLSEITLGPQVSEKERWETYFQFRKNEFKLPANLLKVSLSKVEYKN